MGVDVCEHMGGRNERVSEDGGSRAGAHLRVDHAFVHDPQDFLDVERLEHGGQRDAAAGLDVVLRPVDRHDQEL